MSAAPYLLDTNAYALFFQNPRTSALDKLEVAVKVDGRLSFFLPQIVSMEIHSVLGKYRRGGATAQNSLCDRKILINSEAAACQNTCIFPARKRMSPKVFGHLQKMIKDIESCRGDIQASLIPIDDDTFAVARQLLVDYSDRFAFGSHDALVAGVLSVAKLRGQDLTLVTSDKALKAVCAAEKFKVFDPAK